ncbi:anti-sigma factor [Streptomyces sp. M41]|uniref:anti-sigma factor n=1 Tax=Streptomyces sp. M41 TaxID=3059412 RepID=UPI00374D954D
MNHGDDPRPDDAHPEDPHLDVGAYALHALPPAEEAVFENHLASCAPCRREAYELTTTATALGAAEARTPSANVRRRVLAQIGTVRQERPAAVARGRRRRLDRALGWALAASVAVAAGLGGVAWWQHSEADTANERIAEARSRYENIAEVISASDATISKEQLSNGATASVITSRAQDRAAFVVSDLPALTGDQVYELWYADADTFRPAGLLPGRGGELVRVLEGPLAEATAVCVTVEPAGGSRQPTSDPLGLIPVPA